MAGASTISFRLKNAISQQQVSFDGSVIQIGGWRGAGARSARQQAVVWWACGLARLAPARGSAVCAGLPPSREAACLTGHHQHHHWLPQAM